MIGNDNQASRLECDIIKDNFIRSEPIFLKPKYVVSTRKNRLNAVNLNKLSSQKVSYAEVWFDKNSINAIVGTWLMHYAKMEHFQIV